MSAQKCLQICAQLSDHINQIQLPPDLPDTLPERLTTRSLQDCMDSLNLTAAKLESFMKDRIERLVTKSRTTMTSEEDLADLVRLQEEWETTLQSREICSRAETHLKQNITVVDNYGTGDAVQFMVSTDGHTVHGKNKGLGWRTRQVGGHLSDLSVQSLSRDMNNVRYQYNEDERPSSRDHRESVPNDREENRPGSEFKERYGPGFKLSPKGTTDTHFSSAPPAEGSPPKR